MHIRRILRALLVGIAAVAVGVAVAAAVLLYTGTGREYLRGLLVARLNDQITGRLTIARLEGDLPNDVVLRDVALRDSAGALVLGVERIAARVNVMQLFSKRIDIARIVFEQPTLVLRHQRGGAWNVARVFARADRDVRDDGGRGFGHWVRIADAHVLGASVTVRVPWSPADELSPADRDSAAAAALAGRTRARVEQADDGLEQVMEFREIDALLPRVLLAHPDTARIVVEVGRAKMIAAPFRPPAADVRDLGGTLTVTHDSLHFSGWRVVMPGSRMAVEVEYGPQSRTLRARLRADPVDFGDLRWLYPALPADAGGSVTIDAAKAGAGPLEVRATDVVASLGQTKMTGALGLALGDTLRIRNTDLRVTQLDTDLLEQLVPRVHSPVSGTLDARVVLDGSLEDLDTDATLDFRDRSNSASRVTARGTVALGGSLGARDLRVHFEPVRAALVRAAVPSVPIRGALAGSARIDGARDRGWRVTGDLSHTDRGMRSRIAGTAHIARSMRDYRFDGRVLPLSLDAIGRAVPDLGLRGIASGPVRVAGTKDSVSFRADLRVARGTLGAAGRVGWRNADPSYDVVLQPDGIDLGALSTRLPAGAVSGSVIARGRGTDPRTMRGDISLALVETRVDRAALDSVRVRASVADGLATVDTALAWTASARVAASGTLGLVAEREGDLRYTVTVDSLGAIDGAFVVANGDPAAAKPERPITGRATTEGVARGSLTSLRLQGRGAFSNVASAGAGAARATLEYVVGVGKDDTLAVRAAIDSVFVRQLRYEQAELTVEGGRQRVEIDAKVRQSADVDLAASAVATSDSASEGSSGREGALLLRDMTLRIGSVEWRSVHPANFTWRGGSLGIDSLDLRGSDGGSLRLAGGLPSSGNGTLELRLAKLGLRAVAMLRQASDPIDGQLAANFRVTGTAANPAATGTAQLTHIVVRDDTVPDVRASLSYSTRDLTARAELGAVGGQPLVVANAGLPIDLALKGVSGPRLARGAPLRADIRADSIPLVLLPRRPQVRLAGGWARGEVAVRGTLDEPNVRGRVDVRDGIALVPDADVTVRDITASARLTTDSLVVDSIVGRSNGLVRASGALHIAGDGAGSVSGRITARDVAVLDGAKGVLHADADIAIAGTTDSLVVTGRTEVLHGFVERKGPGEQALHVAAAGDPEIFTLIDTSDVARRQSLPESVRPRRAIHTDLSVRIHPGVSYRSAPNAKVEVFTPRDIRVRGEINSDDVAAGGVVVTQGGVYVFRLRPFAIIRGAATLAGASGVAPLIRATGEHDVWIVGRGLIPVHFIASGFPSDVRFSLGGPATLPAAPPDLASYLSLGRPRLSLLQSEASSLSGLSTSGGRFTGELGALTRRQQVSPALGAVFYQLAKGARDAAGVGLFTAMPTDLPPELSESRLAGIHGTTLETGYLFGSGTYLAARVRLSAVAPGVVLVHRFQPGLHLTAGYEPLFRLGDPVLGRPQQGVLRRAFGAFLTKDWWF